jgi:hypothetical protein
MAVCGWADQTRTRRGYSGGQGVRSRLNPLGFIAAHVAQGQFSEGLVAARIGNPAAESRPHTVSRRSVGAMHFVRENWT